MLQRYIDKKAFVKITGGLWTVTQPFFANI